MYASTDVALGDSTAAHSAMRRASLVSSTAELGCAAGAFAVTTRVMLMRRVRSLTVSSLKRAKTSSRRLRTRVWSLSAAKASQSMARTFTTERLSFSASMMRTQSKNALPTNQCMS